MKVLVIQAGTPVNPENFKGQPLVYEPTLTHGMQHFRYSEILNNMQMRGSLGGQGIEVDYVYFTGRKNLFNCIKAAFKIRKLAKQHGYDVINQYWGGPGSFFAACMSKSTYVITYFNNDLYGRYRDNGLKTMKGELIVFFSRLTAVFASGVIVMSEKMKDQLWKSTRHKANVICEGIDTVKFYPVERTVARQHLGWQPGIPVVLFFPSESNVKNMPLAMASFEKLKARIPGARLVLVYYVPHSELVWHYNAADLLLITSFREGSNNSLKEALACNLPVVTVDVGDAKEMLDGVHPSEVVPDFNVRSLADAMYSILKDPRRSNGTSKVPGFTLDTIAAKVLDYYFKLTGSKPLKERT